MGRTEMLILLGAIAIFGRFTLTINHSRYTNEFWIIQTEAQSNASALVAQYLDEAAQRAFDEATIDGAFLSGGTADLTASTLLGAESGETYPNFDDIDDYGSLSLTVTGSNGITYQIQGTVCYVSSADPTTPQTTQTYYKKLTITVSSEFMTSSHALSRIFSYYHVG